MRHFTQRYVNPATGLVEPIAMGTSGNATSVQDLGMDWDRVGNLKQRADYKANQIRELSVYLDPNPVDSCRVRVLRAPPGDVVVPMVTNQSTPLDSRTGR